MGKYFNSPVITPLLSAAGQNAVYADGDVVFNWASFDIPRGAARIIGATIVTKKNKQASSVAPIDLLFAKDGGTNTAPTNLAADNAQAWRQIATYDKKVIGFLPGAVTDCNAESAGDGVVEIQTSSAKNLVLESDVDSGTNVGYDRYYIAGPAGGALDLRSLVALDDDVTISGNPGTINTLDGQQPNLVFEIGDILHVQDGVELGEVASLDANSITFKLDGSTSTNHAVVLGNQTYTVPADLAAWRTASGDLADDDLIYNIYPMRIVLHLER